MTGHPPNGDAISASDRGVHCLDDLYGSLLAWAGLVILSPGHGCLRVREDRVIFAAGKATTKERILIRIAISFAPKASCIPHI